MELFHELVLPGTDIETVCSFDYTPYDSGRTSGPPEQCYPPEGGDAELNSVTINGEEIIELLTPAAIRMLTTQCEEWARHMQSAGDL